MHERLDLLPELLHGAGLAERAQVVQRQQHELREGHVERPAGSEGGEVENDLLDHRLLVLPGANHLLGNLGGSEIKEERELAQS